MSDAITITPTPQPGLKVCPWCRGDCAVVFGSDDPNAAKVQCTQCRGESRWFTSGSGALDAAEAAREFWNSWTEDKATWQHRTEPRA